MISLKSKSSTEHLRQNDWRSGTGFFWLHFWEMTRQKRKLSRRHRKFSPPTRRGAENVQRRQRGLFLIRAVVEPTILYFRSWSALIIIGLICFPPLFWALSAQPKISTCVQYKTKKTQAQKALPSSPLFAPSPSYRISVGGGGGE